MIKKHAENKETVVKNVEVETLVDKLETLKVDKLNIEEAKIETDDQIIKNENYFSKTTKTIEAIKAKKEIDEIKLDEIKKKIKDNKDKLSKYKESKEMPVDEAFKLLKEHEKRIHVIKNYYIYLFSTFFKY